MHEMALAMQIIEVIKDQAAKSHLERVSRASLKIGRMAAFQKDQLEFCLTTYEKESIMKGVRFDIETVDVELECSMCHYRYPDSRFSDDQFAHDIAHAPGLYQTPPCSACGAENASIVSGKELELIAIEGD